MKKLLLSTFAFFLFTFSFAQEYGWVNITGNLPDTPYDTVYNSPDDFSIPLFRGMFFINDKEGWVGNTYAQDSHTIYHTIDGGESWEAQFIDYGTRAIYMLDSLTGYAGGDGGRLNKTTDGGDNWVFHGATGATITHISFPTDSDTGYCCGDKGKIYQITPSGVNNISLNTTGITLQSICFPSSTTEDWACGDYYIFHYIDGSWINTDQSCENTLSHSSIYFVPGTTQGWCVGTWGLIEHTTDGKNWVAQENPDTSRGNGYGESLSSVFFRDTSTGWAVGESEIILHTTDGGINWKIQKSGTTNFLTKVFASPSNVYACGENHTILKYTKLTSSAETSLSEILISNEVLESFEASTLIYTINLPIGSKVPAVDATPSTSGATIQITQAAGVPGTASITVTSPDGSASNTYTINFTVTTAIEDFVRANELNLFPNPVSDILYFEQLPKTTAFDLKIMDIQGRVIYSQKSFSGKSIDVSELQAGIYYLTLQSKNEMYNTRFIKK